MTVKERLLDTVYKCGVKIINDINIREIDYKNNKVLTDKKYFSFDKLIIATGGITESKTGSESTVRISAGTTEILRRTP